MNPLRCPLDHNRLKPIDQTYVCSQCDRHFPLAEVIPGNPIPDLRCLDQETELSLRFIIPLSPLTPDQITRLGHATRADFRHAAREEIRKKYGTKLQKEVLYYLQEVRSEIGKDAAILDLGCGSGGNKKFLKNMGFQDVTSVDYWSSGAEFLVDVHRLPFENASFDLVLTTATLEHFYNPFIAFHEISRIQKPGGRLIASGSFWESWHAHSYFHFTPDGLNTLCQFANLALIDLWSGWGFIPSVSSHALNLHRLRPITYGLQALFDSFLQLAIGKEKAFSHRLRTSGSIGIYARKSQ